MVTMYKDRISTIFVGPGELLVKNDSLLFRGTTGDEFFIPVNQFCVVCIEPGTSITHAAVKLCSDAACMLNWVGENGVRLYSSGSFSALRSERLWCQITQATNKNKSLSVAKRMYSYRFSLTSIGSYSVEQMSGLKLSEMQF
jgi:CRISPR-associated protein Cas1